MTLDHIDESQECKILNVLCNNELKQRFYSFGIIKGATLIVSKVSLAKNTLEVIVDDTSIGMRIEEAKQIIVEKK
jgi:ferrous iron transport protein A